MNSISIGLLVTVSVVFALVDMPLLERPGTKFAYVKHTRASFSGTFSCDLDETFCVTGYYKEWNIIFPDYLIWQLPFYCTSGGIMRHNQTVKYLEGDGYFDFWYEAALELFHNCSSNSTVHRIEHFFPDMHITREFWSHEYELNITDTGKTKPFEEGAAIPQRQYEKPVYDWIYENGVVAEMEELPEFFPFYNDTKDEEGLLFVDR